MAKYQQYETRPIECWGKAQEIRQAHIRHVWEVQQKGGLLVHGLAFYHSVLAGMGDIIITECTPRIRDLMIDPQKAIKAHEAAEARGLGPDICSMSRCHLGALYMGFSLCSPEGRVVTPDFCFQGLPCNSLAKASQLYSDYLHRPYFTIDIPYKDSPATRQLLVEQVQEAIEWMEGITGRHFDDERFIEGVRNEWESTALFARILDMNRAIPAPLDVLQIFTLQFPINLGRHGKEVVEFYRSLADDVAYRVKQGISARGYESCRLLHLGFLPMYYTRILRYPNRYGGIFVAANQPWLYGAWESLDFKENSWRPAPLTPEAAGFSLKSREDALRALAQLYIAHLSHICSTETQPEAFISMLEEWRGDGAIFHLDRGCKNGQSGLLEARLALQESGVRTQIYEASGYDPRDLSESQVLDRFDSFMEILGLIPIAPGVS